MGLMRNYCIIRKDVADHYGYDQYITFAGTEGYRYTRDQMRAIGMSDYVIQCDENGNSRYIKNRDCHKSAQVNPEEFVWIKLSAVEIN